MLQEHESHVYINKQSAGSVAVMLEAYLQINVPELLLVYVET